MGYNPTIPHLEVGYNPLTNYSLTSKWTENESSSASWPKGQGNLLYAGESSSNVSLSEF